MIGSREARTKRKQNKSLGEIKLGFCGILESLLCPNKDGFHLYRLPGRPRNACVDTVVWV